MRDGTYWTTYRGVIAMLQHPIQSLGALPSINSAKFFEPIRIRLGLVVPPVPTSFDFNWDQELAPIMCEFNSGKTLDLLHYFLLI